MEGWGWGSRRGVRVGRGGVRVGGLRSGGVRVRGVLGLRCGVVGLGRCGVSWRCWGWRGSRFVWVVEEDLALVALADLGVGRG